MHVWPVIVQRNAPRVGMPCGFQSKPVLDLALLPVDGGELRGQRRKRGILRGNWGLQNQPGWVARPIEDIVDVEDSLHMHAILGEDRHKSRLTLVSKCRAIAVASGPSNRTVN